MKRFYVYIMASKKEGTLYTGVTSDLPRRIWEHKNGVTEGFTKRYAVDRLVHFEVFDDFEKAVLQEKRLKRWRRAWKVELIEKSNPGWLDIYEDVCA